MNTHQELDPALIHARNSPGSVAMADFDIAMSRNRHLAENFWDGSVFNRIHYHKIVTKKPDISLCDLGCGVGTQITRMALEAKRAGLITKVTALDKIPGNVFIAKQKLKTVGVEDPQCVYGDVTKIFPNGQFDLISAFELIHWLTPDETNKLLRKIRQHLAPNGLFVASYATELNNALLQDQNGELNLERNFSKDKPIHRYSYGCQSWMTFWNWKDLAELARQNGLQGDYYLETDNNYFPTTKQLNIPRMSERFVSTENAYIGFHPI